MGDHICDDSKLIIQVTGHGHDNPKKQPQQLMFYKDNYKTPQEAIKLKEGTTKLQEDEYPSRYECPSILFEYPECDAKDSQLAIKIPKVDGGEIILPLLDKIIGRKTEDNWSVYKSHRLLAIVPMTHVANPEGSQNTYAYNYNRKQHALGQARYALAREGYFYVFINGKVWREIKISQKKGSKRTVYQDTDLTSYRNGSKEFRKVEGVELSNIWIPAAFPNQNPIVEVAYIEEQLSYERLNYLEKNDTARNQRCHTIKVSSEIQKVNTSNHFNKTGILSSKDIAFSLTNLPEHRPRNFEIEMQLDNPSRYLANLSTTYQQDVLALNQNGMLTVKDKAGYARYYIKKNELQQICGLYFETGAWLKLYYQKDPAKNKNLADIDQAWPNIAKTTTFQEGQLAEAKSLESPVYKEDDALADHKKNYILGINIEDPVYYIHHLTRRISDAATLLQKLTKQAEQRNSFYIAALVNAQRGLFGAIDEGLRDAGSPVRQNYGYAIAELERQDVVDFINKCQKLLTDVLQTEKTHYILADLLSDSNAVDYSGHLLMVGLAFNAISSPANRYDPLVSPSLKKENYPGEIFLQQFALGSYKQLSLMLRSSVPNETILKELLQYRTRSIEPTSNQGDGAFKLYLLRQLNELAKVNKTPTPQSYNGQQIKELIEKIGKAERTSEEHEYQEKMLSQKEGNTVTYFKGMSGALMAIATLFENKVTQIKDDIAKQELQQKQNQIQEIKNRRYPTQTAETGESKPSNGTKKESSVLTGEDFQKHHVNVYHNLRELDPDLFKDLRLVSADFNATDWINSRDGRLLGVDRSFGEVLEELASTDSRGFRQMYYNRKYLLVEVRKGSKLDQLFSALESGTAFSEFKESFTKHANKLWDAHYAKENLTYKNLTPEELAQKKQNFIKREYAAIYHEMLAEEVELAKKSGDIVHHDQGTFKEIANRNLGMPDDVDKKLKIKAQYSVEAKAQLAARSVSGSRVLEALDKTLNSKVALGIFLSIELWNIKAFIDGYQSLDEQRGAERKWVGLGSVAIDAFTVTTMFLEKTRLNTILMINGQGGISVFLEYELLGTPVLGWLNRVGIILTTAVCLSDALYELRLGHGQRAIMSGMIAAGFAMMYFSGSLGAFSALIGIGPIGWIALGVGVVIAGVVGLIYLNASDMQDWFVQGPFADFTRDWIPTVSSHLIIQEEAYYRFISLLLGLRVRIEPNPDHKKNNRLRLTQDSTSSQKISQAQLKITVESNAPAILQCKNTADTLTVYCLPITDNWTPIAIPNRILHEELTEAGKVLYMSVDKNASSYTQGKVNLQVWAQLKADLNYMGCVITRRFPAPTPSKDVLWNEAKYGKPNFSEGATDFWYSQTFETTL